jgi:hypothetical protein
MIGRGDLVRGMVLNATRIELLQVFVPRSYAGLMWLIRTDAIALGG